MDVRKVLGAPLMHGVVATVFFVAFMWPFLSFAEPVNTWAWLYSTWALAVVALIAINVFGAEPTEDDEDDAEVDHV